LILFLEPYFFTRIFFLRLAFFVLGLTWIIGLISPCLDTEFLHSVYPFLKQTYSTVCHQNESKTFHCGQSAFFVCARCTGIYAGAVISSFIILILKIKLQFKYKYLLLLSIPMLSDVILYSIGLYNYSKIVSSISGLLFGSSVFLYILTAIEKSLYTKNNFTNEY